MRNKSYKKLDGIVTREGSKYSPVFDIDFDKLSEVTNHHEEFLNKVKTNYSKYNDSFNNVVAFIDEEVHTFGPQKGDKVVRVFMVFDHHDTYIRLFGCDINHEKHPYIFELSQNKTFVSMMSDLL